MELGGEPLVVRAALNLCAAGVPVHCVVRDSAGPVAQALGGIPGVAIGACPDAHLGMGRSLAWGVAATPSADAWLVALGDMPEVAPNTIGSLIRALRDGGAREALTIIEEIENGGLQDTADRLRTYWNGVLSSNHQANVIIVQILAADLGWTEQLARQIRGCGAAYYLVHSMQAVGPAYAEVDRTLARSFAAAADDRQLDHVGDRRDLAQVEAVAEHAVLRRREPRAAASVSQSAPPLPTAPARWPRVV